MIEWVICFYNSQFYANENHSTQMLNESLNQGDGIMKYQKILICIRIIIDDKYTICISYTVNAMETTKINIYDQFKSEYNSESKQFRIKSNKVSSELQDAQM